MNLYKVVRRISIRPDLEKTLAYYTAFVILGLVSASLGPTLQSLAGHVRSTISQISYLFVLRSMGYLFGSFIAGRVYDRVKGHPVMVGVIIAMAGLMAFIPIISILWLLAGLLFFLGLVEGVLDVGGNTLLVWVHRDKMGPYMNGLHFFFGLGAFLSPVIIAQTVLLTGDINWAYWSLALLMLPSTIWLFQINSPISAEIIGAITHRPVIPVLVGLLAIFDFLYVGTEVSFGGWISTYATTMRLGNTIAAAYLTSAFWGAITVGRLFSIPLSKRFTPGTILLCDLSLLAVSQLLIFTFPGSLIALWIGVIGSGVGMASIFPTVLALAEKYMSISGFVTSCLFIGSSLGGITIPWLIGQLFTTAGPRVMVFTILCAVVTNLLIFAGIAYFTHKLPQNRIL